MKKLFSRLLCGALAAMALSVTAFAAETGLLISPAPSASVIPERQGDFYVMVNGEYVTFPDAVPQARDNRSFLPMAAVFSQLGFAQEDMTWTPDGSITATKDGLIVALTLGKPEITIIRGEETTTVATDVAPYVDPATWRTYVPFGLVADALGYKVAWDGETGTVIIDDVAAILAGNTETYGLMDQYTAYRRGIGGETASLRGNYAFGLVMGQWTGGSVQDTTLLLQGQYGMTMRSPGALEFDAALNTTFSETINGEDVTQARAASSELPLPPEELTLSVRGDLEQGTLYLRSDGLLELLNRPDLAGAWLSLDLAESSAGVDRTQILAATLASGNGQASFPETLEAMLHAAPVTGVSMTTRDYLALYNAMFADSAFTETDAGYVNHVSSPDFSMTITLPTKNDRINGCTVELHSSDAASLIVGTQGGEMLLSMNVDTGSAADLTAPEGSYVVMSLGMDGVYADTTVLPSTQPPAGAVIVDLLSLVEIPDTP